MFEVPSGKFILDEGFLIGCSKDPESYDRHTARIELLVSGDNAIREWSITYDVSTDEGQAEFDGDWKAIRDLLMDDGISTD